MINPPPPDHTGGGTITAGAHGDADVGGGEGWGVVAAVPGYRNHLASPLQNVDDAALGGGGGAGDHRAVHEKTR